jgi:hypothetical protein
MTARGGYEAIYPTVILHGEAFADLSEAALGAWLRLRSVAVLVGEPPCLRQLERAGVTSGSLSELLKAGLALETDGHYTALGMPEPPRPPSDSPEARRERQRRHRMAEACHEGHGVTSVTGEIPVDSSPVQSSVTGHGVTSVTGGHDDARVVFAKVTGRVRPPTGSAGAWVDRLAETFGIAVFTRALVQVWGESQDARDLLSRCEQRCSSIETGERVEREIESTKAYTARLNGQEPEVEEWPI